MIFNMVGGGGGSGATLVVSSPANVSVTVSKDDKSYTKNSGSLGSTTFKGLATGTWTVTISGNGQTATKTIEITADYAITIAFFSATINITYPANSNCVVTNSSGQTVASNTNTGSSAKTWTATVGATGTYTVTATATDGSGKSNSQSVSITADGQSESVKLMYNVYLYNDGDQCTDITGGWEEYTYAGSYGGSSASVTKNTNNVVIAASRGSMPGSGHASAYLYTIGPVNLKYFKEIRTTVSQYSGGSAYIEVSSEPPSSPSSTVIASAGISGTGTKSLMIENIESGYVAVGMDTGAFAEGQSGSMTITKIECVG